jgi:hypothetical protein
MALLAVLAIVFGLTGTSAPAMKLDEPHQLSSSNSVTHFQNPPTYDSGWVDIRNKTGQYVTLKHELNTTEVVVEITGKRSLNPEGSLAWSRTYEGPAQYYDYAYSVVQTSDGGYAIAGYDTFNIWLLKTDATGNPLWNQTYGEGEALSMVQTFDGGYALAGASGSDFGLVKVDSAGNLEWNQTYGGANSDWAESVVQTSDGGYALAGKTNSFGAGQADFWLIKTNSTGNPVWNQTYGGTENDFAQSVVQTFDGGYALAGYTYSYAVESDFWLVKVNVEMNQEHQLNFGGTGIISGWRQTYGGVDYETAFSMVQTIEGEFALAGYTLSYGAGISDFWLVKTDSAGNLEWSQTYGGTDYDIAYSLVQTVDGGYALAGYTKSYGAGSYDFWLVKTDSAGNHLWNQTYGGTAYDTACSLVQTSDGGFTIAGYTSSFGAGGYDLWLVKTNVAGNTLWNQTYGGTENEFALSVVETVDGGYALAGYTKSFGAGLYDFWLVKTDSAGNMQWSQTYGGASNDYDRAYSMVQTSEGGYALAGHTYSFDAGSADLWLVKTDVESGLAWTGLTNSTITLYRGRTDPYWNYVRVRIWLIKEPTWQWGDINQDGVVDIQDLYILSQNYGKTFSLLSLTGIIAIAGIHQIKKRKQKQT